MLATNAPVTAQLTFIAPTDTQPATSDASGWVDAEDIGDSVVPDSLIRDSLAPGEVLVEPSIVHDVASRPRGSFFSSAPQQPAHPAVVRVVAADFGGASLGSGTLVDVNDDHGLVVTNWHVVRDAPGNVIVVFPDGFQSLGRVLRMDANWDLAAILINKPRAAPVRLAADAPQIGETLTIAGYGGGSYRAVAGACTGYLAPSVQHPQELVELAASARQGDSGGPIFNARGELAGVLFGEAGGRTTGAYCGRVHNFLASAVQQLYQSNGSMLASRPERVQASQPPANVVAATPANTQVASDPSPGAGPPPDSAQTTAPASFYAATPSRGGNTEAAAASIGPVAAIDAPAMARDGAGFPTSTIESAQIGDVPSRERPSSPQNSDAAGLNGLPIVKQDAAEPAANGETDSLTWQFFAGDTLISQLKTVLACIGIAAILIHGTRALAHTTTGGGQSPAKRAKKLAQ